MPPDIWMVRTVHLPLGRIAEVDVAASSALSAVSLLNRLPFQDEFPFYLGVLIRAV